MQTILTIIIVALCTAYALWRCYRVLRRPPDCCADCTGCPLKSHCTTASLSNCTVDKNTTCGRN